MIKRISTFAIITIAFLIYPLSHAHGNGSSQTNGAPALENGLSPANKAPVAVDSIASVRLGNDPVTVDISDKFRDPDDDKLVYTVTVSDKAILSAHVDSSNVDSSKVIINPKSGLSTTITVTAEDRCDQSAEQTIMVTVSQPPVAVGTIAPVKLGNDSVTVDISDKFRDPDGDKLTYTAVSSADTIATVRVDGSKVTISPEAVGYATITVTATNSTGLQAKQYIVTVPKEIITIEHVIMMVVVIGIGGLLLQLTFNFQFNIHGNPAYKVEKNKGDLGRLQFIIGVLGIGVPLFLIIGICAFEYVHGTLIGDFSKCVKNSISAYYDSKIRDVFVGILCVIGAFLFAYKGYDYRDDRVSHLAGLSAFGVALCPITSTRVIEVTHYLSIIVLFLALAYISRYRFTKSKCESIQPRTPKAKRNMVYTWCAYIMVFSLLAMGAFKLLELPLNDNKVVYWVVTSVLLLGLLYFCILTYFLWHSTEKTEQSARAKGLQVILFVLLAVGVGVWVKHSLSSFPFIFVAEAVMFLAFGVSWLVKSDALKFLCDKNENDEDKNINENGSAETESP